ncbi:hypothetical protein [Mesoplasma melaleucae]|uniref:Lipoprotein n=1 Tax=Mesoplasma melaleucae TaxID=81459 RepID=A0A2K8NX03_9MOLU|nr:hypothetical protein [Mesoplasma melaleucae]ATZ18066.1 hypothetical protein EMELA_v1c05310 [Mesoplasma melaleucae]
MKKMITLLGAATLSVSSATAVVGCSNNSVAAYNNFAKFANATKPTFDEEGKVTKQGSTLIYYIGAEDNLSSLSFEYAMKVASGVGETATLDEAFNKINDAASSNTFINDFKQIGETLKTNDKTGADDQLAQTEVKYNKKKSLWYFESQSNGFSFSNGANSNKIEIQGSTVETVGDLWTDKGTKKILNDWIKPSVARMVYSETQQDSWDKTKDKTKIETLNKEINDRVDAIKSSKGPLFLIVRNGEFIGYLEGFNVYNEVFVNGEDNSSLKPTKYDQKELIDNFDKGINSIINNKDIVFNTYKTGSTSHKLTSDAWKWEHWDNWVVRDSTSSSSSFREGEGASSTSYSYTYNLNKY